MKYTPGVKTSIVDLLFYCLNNEELLFFNTFGHIIKLPCRLDYEVILIKSSPFTFEIIS